MLVAVESYVCTFVSSNVILISGYDVSFYFYFLCDCSACVSARCMIDKKCDEEFEDLDIYHDNL